MIRDGVLVMEKILEKTLLFDFYGELLTKHQQDIYENVVLNDMTLSEAAELYGISRQGIHDVIRRCDKIMEEFEEKLHNIERYENIRKKVLKLKKISGEEENELLDGILEDLDS